VYRLKLCCQTKAT